MPEKLFRAALREALLEEMERDERIFLIGEDIGLFGGAYRVTEGLLDQFGEMRVVDAPIAEEVIVGCAIGAAMSGLRPVVEMMTINFSLLAYDQIVQNAAKIRYMFGGEVGVPMVMRLPGGAGHQLSSQHSHSFEVLYALVPGLLTVAPTTPEDAKGLLKSAVRDPDPVMYFEHKKTYRLIKGEIPEGEYVTPIGPAAVRREGNKLSCVAWGLMTHYCLEAAESVAAEGISVEVIDLRTLRPLDTETILGSVEKTARAMVVYEDNLTGGFGAEVAAVIAGDGFRFLDAPVTRVAGPDVPAMPFNKAQEEAFMPSPSKIADAMRKLSAY